MSKILITGGFGFIGSHLIKTLLAKDHDITIIDNLSSGKEIANKDILFYKMDVQDKKCEKLFQDSNFDIVIHLAFKGYSGEDYSLNFDDYNDNIVGLSNILRLSKKYNVEKVLILSSLATENKKEVNSYYSREVIAREFQNMGLNITILKTGAVYGPGQYGSDLSIFKSSNYDSGNLIHIYDLCKAVSKVMESYTGSVIDISNNSKDLKFTLDWYPEINPKDGIREVQYIIDEEKPIESETTKVSSIKEFLNRYKSLLENKDIEVVLFFIIIFILNNIVRFKLGLNLDLFIPFIVFISMIYGLKYGLTAVLLSIISYIYFYFNYEEKTALMLISDINSILYLTIYFGIGAGIGYYIEEQKRDKAHLTEEIEIINDEIKFMNTLYEKSQEVKNNLQFTIQNYENNLTKINNIIETLISSPKKFIYDEISEIYMNYFYADSVGFYSKGLDDKKYILISKKGKKDLKDSLSIIDYDFLAGVIYDKEIFVNRKLKSDIPMVVLPIYKDNLFLGFVFLDDINFNFINQNYINDLKVTSKLISNMIYIFYIQKRL